MAAGSVTVDSLGNETIVVGSVSRLYARMKANHEALSGTTIGSDAIGIAVKQGLASAATMLGEAIVEEIGHTTAQVTAGGLQRVGSTPTDAPASPQSIPLVHS